MTHQNADAQVRVLDFSAEAIAELVAAGSPLVPEQYDEIDLSYTAGKLTGVVYKQAGLTVATLTLTYAAPGGKLSKIVRT